MLFVLGWLVFRPKTPTETGYRFSCFKLAYFTFRFGNEFLRIEPVFAAGLTAFQWVCLLAIPWFGLRIVRCNYGKIKTPCRRNCRKLPRKIASAQSRRHHPRHSGEYLRPANHRHCRQPHSPIGRHRGYGMRFGRFRGVENQESASGGVLQNLFGSVGDLLSSNPAYRGWNLLWTVVRLFHPRCSHPLPRCHIHPIAANGLRPPGVGGAGVFDGAIG